MALIDMCFVEVFGIDEVELWRVVGIAGVWFPTKMAAEVAARVRFPTEDEARRYSRVYCSKFMKV